MGSFIEKWEMEQLIYVEFKMQFDCNFANLDEYFAVAAKFGQNILATRYEMCYQIGTVLSQILHIGA